MSTNVSVYLCIYKRIKAFLSGKIQRSHKTYKIPNSYQTMFNSRTRFGLQLSGLNDGKIWENAFWGV